MLNMFSWIMEAATIIAIAFTKRVDKSFN